MRSEDEAEGPAVHPQFEHSLFQNATPEPRYLQNASNACYRFSVAEKSISKRRSGCPVSVALERFGDRWSLLIIRDLMVRGYRTFKDFQTSGEGIATNILADRLQKLQEADIITAETVESDGRRLDYRLTEKGIDLAPVLLELLIWAARHEETGAPCSVIAEMAKNREYVLAETRRRWLDRDPIPLLPPFPSETSTTHAQPNKTERKKK